MLTKPHFLKSATLGLALLATTLSTSVSAAISFTPLPGSAPVGALPLDKPFLLPLGWEQQLLISSTEWASPRATNDVPTFGIVGLTSMFDQLAVNKSGPDAGRYIFIPHELFTGIGANGGISRYDRVTDTATTLVQRADLDSVDLADWTPWGTVIIGEESAGTATFRDPAFPDVRNGMIYEIINPLAAPADIQIIGRPRVGSSAHEGFDFAPDGSMYYIDEQNGGAIYKFVPKNGAAGFDPANPSSSPLASGQVFALQVTGAGTTASPTGAAIWVALNNPDGTPIVGITDPTIDARAAADEAGASNYQRPEDLDIILRGAKTYVQVTTTTTGQTFTIDITAANAPVVKELVGLATINAATGLGVGGEMNAPDNTAVDAFGQLYIIEDFVGGDIWQVTDANGDGIAEFISRFASLSTPGAEPTGFIWNPFNPFEAFVSVQHPAGGDDQLFRIFYVPEPSTLALLGLGLAGAAAARRRRRRA
jgi:uncharacterized protein